MGFHVCGAIEGNDVTASSLPNCEKYEHLSVSIE
jgi:hypothetical protein